MRNALVLSFVIAFAAGAQETPRLGETVDVSIVNVDVVVTDKAGNRVHGLKQEDFELRENGKVKPISNFAEYASEGEQGTVGVEVAERQAQPAVPAAAPREKRTLLIFFEEMQLANFAADQFTKGISETVRQLIAPGDSVSVVIWSQYRIQHVEFTSEPRQIADAIKLVNETAKGARINMTEIQRKETANMRELMAAQAGPGGGAPAMEASTDPGGDVALFMLMAYNEMVVRVAAINSAINSMAGHDGKKILLLATRRLGEVAGAEFAFQAGADRISPYLRTRFNTDELRKSIIDNANASGVTIYPVNPPGAAIAATDTESYNMELGANVALRGVAEQLTLVNETVNMEKIAEQTGGLMAVGTAKIVDLLPRVVSDASDYYSLAYRVTNTNTDQSRKIVVTTRNPEYKVRARTAFVEKSDDTRMRDRLRGTLFRAEQPGATIAIRAAARPSKKTSRKKTMMEVRVRIPIGGLTILPQANGKHGGKFSIYVAAATDLHQLSDVTQKSQPFEVAPSELEQARTSHFTYDLDVEVNDKSKYLAVGVFDEVGKTYGLMRIDLQKDVKPAATPAATPPK
jgi:VWFA-related protein